MGVRIEMDKFVYLIKCNCTNKCDINNNKSMNFMMQEYSYNNFIS